MSEELKKVLKELHGITNKFSLTGEGVAGNLKEGYTVDVPSGGGVIEVPTTGT